jgi:hypothetical protein
MLRNHGLQTLTALVSFGTVALDELLRARLELRLL